MSAMYKKLAAIARNITLLFVEDEDGTRHQYENIFGLLFKDVTSAKNGQEALNLFKNGDYDLLITDLTMPQMNGVDLITEVLKLKQDQHTIIMTAHNTSENLRNSIDFQVDGILLKPVLMDNLFKLLYKVCHSIDIEKKNGTITGFDTADFMKCNADQAYFVLVINNYYDIIHQFGVELKQYIVDAVKEHLSYFGIEETQLLQLHDDSFICSTDKKNFDVIMDSLQEFSNFNNSLLVMFNSLRINISLSYGLIMKQGSLNTCKNENIVSYIDHVISDIKSNDYTTSIVTIDIDQEMAKKQDSLQWLSTTVNALEQNTIVPFYQPIISLSTKEIVSYEVFSRIKQNTKYILPRFFIDLSEKAGILVDISEVIFRKSFEIFTHNSYNFHINLGQSELRYRAISDYLIYLSNHYDISPQRVVLEISEYKKLANSKAELRTVQELKQIGFKIAFKGFSAGNVDFEVLGMLQPDYIKISQPLIQESLSNPHTQYVLSFLLNYAKKYNIKSIVVNVENEEILDEAKRLEIDYAQGFLIREPSDTL